MLPKLASALSLSPSSQSTSPTFCGTLKARQPPAPFADAPVQTSMLLLLTSSAVSRSNRPPVPTWLHSANSMPGSAIDNTPFDVGVDGFMATFGACDTLIQFSKPS